ncbi:AsmA-like protein [Rhizobium sp. PP-F2F-G48]|uniref:YhdP family protein n=1 Tax=Rhizobium sp. PP-F2F-G48 TaxID=2135651 RepID=UPI00104B3D4B|nr:DUF3971 domain-containing protein [Rhizobium sp. PP-F2F-G48]TCM58961.1 AsmA-like protein [Rhizobium sp. PP-F2F-G48]
MIEIRGEKTVFRKEDIVALHSLPSAQAHDPCILHATTRRRWPRRCLQGLLGLGCVLILLVAGLVVAVEAGGIDRILNTRAQMALNNALGDAYHVDVSSTVVRLTGEGALALKAQDVSLKRSASGEQLLTTESVFIELDPLSLLSGRVSVSRIEAEGARLAPAILPQGKPLDLTRVRIADVSGAMEAIFAQMDTISSLIARSGTQVVRIADVMLPLSGPRNRVVKLDVHSLDFARAENGSMTIRGDAAIDGTSTALQLTADSDKGRIVRLGGALTGLPTSALLYRAETKTEPPFGLDTKASVNLTAVRAGEGIAPELTMSGALDQGVFVASGLQSELLPSDVNLAYDFGRGSIEVKPSTVRLGKSVFPFSGAVRDIDSASAASMAPAATLAEGTPPSDPLSLALPKGFSIDVLVQGGTSAPIDVNEPPLTFDAKVAGDFQSERHALLFRELTVSSKLGTFAGSLSIAFSSTSPQINFAGLTTDMQTAGIKQLWPWWVGKKARAWVISNIFGGTVNNGRIEVAIEEGRLAQTAGPVELGAGELTIDFGIDGARVNIAGDIPPLRDATGHFTLRGERAEVDINSGTAYFPSGRTVAVNNGNLILPNTYAKPLMAELKLQVTGQADAIAELVSYRPLEALQKTPFKADDFSGPMTANVGARFGLARDQHPPPPEWQAEMRLDGVSLKPAMAGRTISDINGTLRIDPQHAVLDAKAAVDGVTMNLDAVEPIGANSPVKRSRTVSGTLPDGALAKFAPGLNGIVDGPIGLDVDLQEGDRQLVKVDLENASLSLPWIGWSKGRGVAATSSLSAVTKDGVTSISDFKISGEGFGAGGSLTIDKAGLAAADLSSVRLAAGDDFAVSVKRQKSGYGVTVNGSSADIRSVIDGLKSPDTKGDVSQAAAKRVSIDASLKSVQGFHSEALSNVDLSYTARGRAIEGLKLKAVTSTGQAVVGDLVSSGADNIVQLTSGDAGALARFADIYANMRGGLLNLKLRDRGGNSWRGTLDLRKFALVNEQRLQSMVSSPSGSNGQSLREAVKKDIDLSSVKFERGFANLALDGGQIALDNGVVRGNDVGATFQGVVRDANGKIDMTGTFMPAYGLNRLFSELPLIGTLLGNGRDRGLLGITFKLTGSFAKPSLTINPLSLIAPGVFRNIFEFN